MAQNGDSVARATLFEWAYISAAHYYHQKLVSESYLSTEDAEELASAYFLEFERALPRLRSATRFTRSVLKRNLKRYLRQKKKRRLLENLLPQKLNSDNISFPDESSTAWENWTDKEFNQYRTVLKALKSVDEVTQQIIQSRLQDPPMQFNAIAQKLNLTETAVRMRATRFYALVRKKYKSIKSITNISHFIPSF